MTERVVELSLIALILIREVMHSIERRDLYNRIMAKDLQEYRQPAKAPKPIKNIINMHRK